MGCLTDETVFAFVEGRLSPEAARGVDQHLSGCADCLTVVAEATKFCFQKDGEPPPGSDLLAPGMQVSRYVIVRPLGAGGAGMVYEARDPELERNVALKVLRPGAPGEPFSADVQAHLLAEARAMARLSHPNVVNVFDAGTIAPGMVFIVMELVEGETLATWLAHGGRRWREVLDAFTDAARGLAAAHTAHLIHRDFKPENVLVGRDARVRVTDFGLARPDATAVPAATSAEATGAVTVTTLAGTPAYMAPEQFEMGVSDARTDQFNFCVSLHLALFGRHPHAGDRGGLLGAVGDLMSGHLPPVVDAGDVPAWLQTLLRRGLGARPEERFSSMDDLITALAGPAVAPKRARRLVGVVITAVALSAAAAAWALLGGVLCGNGRVELGEECDDGNPANTDGCTACHWARCGDGVVRGGVEECDDGNTRDGDGCSSSCLTCRAGDASFVWDKNGHCYSRHDRPLTWQAARAECGRIGADLVKYVGNYESSAVRATLLVAHPTETWIGLSADAAGTFTWVAGEPLISLTAWAGGEPAVARGRCVFQTVRPQLVPATVDSGIRWSTADCAGARGFVCERTDWTIRPADNHAYWFGSHPVTWDAARAVCAARGSHLVTIESADEQSFVAAQSAVELWIGATDRRAEGRFEWMTGEPFAFQHFAPGEPDDARGTDDCALAGSDEVWHDRPCNQLHSFLCEIE